MFRILKDPQLNFMKSRNILLGISLALVVASVGIISVKGLNLGIEFTGGAELQLKFADTPDIGDIRSALVSAGKTNNTVTTIGDPAANEVYVRLGVETGEAESKDLTSEVVELLRGTTGSSHAEGAADLNVVDQPTLERLLGSDSLLGAAEAREIAAAISATRKEVAIFHSFEELADVQGVTPAVVELLRRETFLGPLALRSQSYIGPAIGRELLNKALFAVLGSLAGMLVYIWIRFQLQWGFAAVVALTHDTLLTLGLFSLFEKEMSLPVVAAFLTLIGYSVNDTVVVFDRIRENLRLRGTEGFESVINLSINQTLSRTIITSGLTWVVVLALFIFGGAALNPFAFVLTVGVVVGTYSSIYVASPFLVLWKSFLEARRGTAPAGRGRRGKAKKIRTSGAG